MLQKYNRYRVLSAFFERPTERLQLREIARLAKLAPLSTMNYLKEFVAQGLIIRSKKRMYPTYQANRDSEAFKRLKRQNTVWKLYDSGFVDYVVSECSPDAVILFGSASRGEDVETSDIDVCIIAAECPLTLKLYEKMLQRKIAPFFSKTFEELSPELKNNILNGTVLYGYVQVF